MPIIGDTQLQPVNVLGSFASGMEMGRSASAARQQEAFNALKMQQAQQEMSDANALRGVLARGAPDDELLRTPGGAALLKQRGEARESMGKGIKAEAEGVAARMQHFRQNIPFNPTMASAWLQNAYADPVVGPELAKMGTLEDAIAAIPQDPAGYLQWMEGAANLADKYVERRVPTADAMLPYTQPLSPEVEAQKVRLAGAGAARTNITNVLPGQERFANTLAEGAAKSLDTLRTGAQSASRSIQTIDRLRPLLNDPKFISGTWANARIAIARALGQDVAATEAYFAGIAGEVAERIKAFGAGTGLSDKDREFAQQWAGGKPDLSTAGIKRILSINENSSRALIGSYNAERERLAKDVDPSVNKYFPSIEEPPRSGGPSPGDVQGGYRFKGGNPADKANWEKVQ